MGSLFFSSQLTPGMTDGDAARSSGPLTCLWPQLDADRHPGKSAQAAGPLRAPTLTGYRALGTPAKRGLLPSAPSSGIRWGGSGDWERPNPVSLPCCRPGRTDWWIWVTRFAFVRVE
jgi:hypothetical protein